MMIEQLELIGGYKLKIGNDTITTFYDPRRKMWRLLRNKRETFYDPETGEMKEWESEQDAIDWLEAEL